MIKNYLFKNVNEFNKIKQRNKHDRVMYMSDKVNVKEILINNVKHKRKKMLIINTLFNSVYKI